MYGIHIHKESSPSLHIRIEEESDRWTAAQIYTHGPRSYNKNNISERDIARVSRNLQLYVHSTHFSKPWKGKENAIGHIKDQMNVAKAIGAKGLVVHLPKDEPQVIEEHLPKILGEIPIILEMTSAKSDPEKTYETPEKLNRLTQRLSKYEGWSYCIDTSHIWAAGQNVKTKEFMDDWFSRISEPHRIQLIHLNGSSVPFNCGKDTHIIPFTSEDKIWHGIPYNRSGVKSVVEFAKKMNIPVIMEINRGDVKDIDMMQVLLKREMGKVRK